jgi:hypothetical protein
MAETKREEHKRLQKRTDKLRKEHEELGVDRKPFDKEEHDRHRNDLQKHHDALSEHRERKPD